MIDALNPFSTYYWGERVPKMDSSSSIKTVLDARAKAEKLDISNPLWRKLIEGPTWIQGGARTVCQLAAAPFRFPAIAVLATGQLVRECPRNSLREQPRVVGRILGACFTNSVMYVVGSIYAIFHPRVMIRSQNGIDVRHASAYTQKSIPARWLCNLYGFPPLQGFAGELDPAIMIPPNGHCYGQSIWLLSLFHHLEARCPDVETRLKAIVRQYQNGSTPEAALLQTLHYRDVVTGTKVLMVNPLIFLKMVVTVTKVALKALWDFLLAGVTTTGLFRRAHTFSHSAANIAYEHGSFSASMTMTSHLRRLIGLKSRGGILLRATGKRSWFRRSYEGFEQLQKLPDGTYLLFTNGRGPGGHATVYVKDSKAENGDNGYFFDPNIGLEKLSGTDHWKHVVRSMDRLNFTQLGVVRVERRTLADQLTLDAQERILELLA